MSTSSSTTITEPQVLSTIATTSSIATSEPPVNTNTEIANSLTDIATDLAISSDSDPTTDMVTQGHMMSSPAPASSSNSIAPAVGGAVGGLIAVIVIIAVVVIALLVIKKGQKGSLKVNDRKESVRGYNNALYDGKQNTQTDE